MKLSVAAVALAMGMAFTAEAAPQAVPTAAPLQVNSNVRWWLRLLIL